MEKNINLFYGHCFTNLPDPSSCTVLANSYFFHFNNPLLYSTYSVYTAPVSFAWMAIAERFFHYFLLFVLFYYRFSVHNYIPIRIYILICTCKSYTGCMKHRGNPDKCAIITLQRLMTYFRGFSGKTLTVFFR